MDRPIKWKNGARCAVALSFDVDGESPWIHRDPALAERPLHMGMGAYGPKTAMPRIMNVLDRYGVKVCFFIPGWIIERYPEMAREAVRRGHEVGHHGYLHEKPFFLSGRRRRGSPREDTRHLPEHSRRSAARLAGAVVRSEQAHDGASAEARLRLSQQHDGYRPAVLPQDGL